MNNSLKKKFVDLDLVLKKQKIKLPKFIVNLLRRLIHEKDFNDFIDEHGDKFGNDFIDLVIKDFDLKLVIKGQENLPKDKDKKLIFVANHPLGGLDGILFARGISFFYPKVRIIVNELLLFLKNFSPLFVGVNIYGKNKQENYDNLENVFLSDNQILIFPAGLVSRKQNSVVEDLKWKSTFIKKAIEHKRNIIPVYIDSNNSKLFYNFAYWRKKLGIKFNYELILLPSEIFKFKKKNKKITFKIGKEISYTDFTEEKSASNWAQEIKNQVYKMA